MTDDPTADETLSALRQAGLIAWITAAASIFCICGPGPLVAIAVGIWARRRATWHQAMYEGPDYPQDADRMARLAGAVCIGSGIVQAILLIVAYVVTS